MKVPGGTTVTRYFGLTTRPLVTRTVYMDADADGGRGPLEPGLPRWHVYIDQNRNGLFDDGEASTLTNTAGRYALDLPSTGSFQIRVIPQDRYDPTSPGAGYRGVTLSAGEVAEARNFGQKRR
jgi:hypothetical protein